MANFKMVGRGIRIGAVFTSVLALSAGFTQSAAYAQDAEDDNNQSLEQPTPDGNIIIVEGIRASIRSATDTKRDLDVIGDAYFAEEIGKSSDENITEALQRLPGVTIERGGEGGDQGTVVVRGIEPALNLVKFNGITLTSNTDDQSVDLTSFSADILANIIVAKSPAASQEEGSLGGTIYLNTASVLDSANDLFVIGAEARYNDLTGDVTPRLTASFAKRLSDSFGVTGSLFFDDNRSRVDTYETFLGAFVDPRNAPLDSETGQVLADRLGLSDGFSNYRLFDRDTQKYGGILSVEMAPGADTRIRADIAYSKQTEDFVMYENRGITSSFGQAAQPDGLSVIDVSTGLVVEYYRAASGSPLIQTREQEGSTENLVLGLDLEHRFGALTINAKYGASLTDQLTGFQTWNLNRALGVEPASAGFGPNNGLCGHQFQSGADDLFLPVYFDCPRFNFSDPSTFGVGGGSFAEREVSDDLHSFYLDLEREFSGGAIESIEVGGKYTTREKDRFSAEAFFGVPGLIANGFLSDSVLTEVVNGNALPATLFNLVSVNGILDGIAPAGASASFPAVDIASVNSFLFPGGVPDGIVTRNPSQQWTVDEETYAGYVQVNYDLMGGRLTGNFGIRYAHTQVVGTGAGGFQFNAAYTGPGGSAYPADFAFPDFQDTNSYGEWLPSINARFEIAEDLQLRVSAARVLARPNLSDLAPGFTVVDRDPGRLPTGSGGNTRLDPFVANQFDASLEWYFNDTGLLSAALFYKDVDSFTYASTIGRNFANPVTGEDCIVNRQNALTLAEQQSATVDEFGCIDVLFSTQVNGASAKLTGMELSYTQTYDFLPGILQFLGASANYTFVDSESIVDPENPDSALNGLPFPNTSRHSFNGVLFWDDGDLSLRLAYTYRDRALITVNNNNSTVIRDDRSVLDFAANYNVTDNLQAFFSASNLTNSYDKLFEATAVTPNAAEIPVQVSSNLGDIPDGRVFRLNHQGRSFRVGLRYTF